MLNVLQRVPCQELDLPFSDQIYELRLLPFLNHDMSALKLADGDVSVDRVYLVHLEQAEEIHTAQMGELT